jgi:hypothetical protein
MFANLDAAKRYVEQWAYVGATFYVVRYWFRRTYTVRTTPLSPLWGMTYGRYTLGYNTNRGI